MKKLGAGFIALLIKLGPKLLSVGTKLLKSAKVVKGTLAVAAFASYAYLFTWQFAVIIIVSTFIHELGHIYAMKRTGMTTKGVYFIPFIGAAAVGDGMFPSRKDECYIALMGPLWGLGTAAIIGCLYFATGIQFLGAAAGWVALVNLFNLLPINPLDGGRVFKSIVISTNTWLGLGMMLFTVAVCIILAINSSLVLFAFLGTVGLLEFLMERWRFKKAIPKYVEESAKLEKLEKINRVLEKSTDEEVLDLAKSLEFREQIQYCMWSAYMIRGTFKDIHEQQLTEVEELKKMLPPEKLTIKQMVKWGLLYLLLTAVLWMFLNLMAHIPGVDIAKDLMAS